MAWNYSAQRAQEYGVLPVGDYRVRIEEVDEGYSRNGNEMWTLTLSVSGSASRLWFYLVFLPDNPGMTDSRLRMIFDSFGIAPGDMNSRSWVGKCGGARVKHEEWNGEPSAKVQKFLPRAQVDALPPWEEPQRFGKSDTDLEAVPDPSQFRPVTDDADLPF